VEAGHASCTQIEIYIHVYVFIRIIASFYEPGYLRQKFPPELPSLWQDAIPRDRYSFHLLPGIPFVRRAINSTNAKCGKLMSAASTWTRESRLACVIRAELLYKPHFQFVADSNSSRSGERAAYALSAIKAKCVNIEVYKCERKNADFCFSRGKN